MDLECQLIEVFGWSLRDIDETDIESLLPFAFRYPDWKKRSKESAVTVYADQVSWL